MGVPSKIACSVQRVTLPNRVLLHRGLRHCDVLIRCLLLSSPGDGWMRDQPGPGSSPYPAKHRLPCRYPTSGSTSSHPRCMFRWREHEALHCAPGKPQDSEISVSAKATFFTQFLPLEISPLLIVFFLT